MPAVFEACRRRIEWAQRHYGELAAAWNRIEPEDLYTVHANVNDDGTGSVWLIKNKPIPPGFALELGELLYQLRAALDSAVYEAAILDSGKNPPSDEHSLEFPVCISPAEFSKKAAFKLRPLADKRKAIIESVQPYNTPKLAPEELAVSINRTLGILNEWARIDRHRRLHVVGSWLGELGFALYCPGATVISMTQTRREFLGDENEIATFRLADYRRGMKVDVNSKLATNIALDEAPPPCADNDTLSYRLTEMLNTVNSIVITLEGSF